MTIVAFDHPVLGSATSELRALGPRFGLPLVAHCQDVDIGRCDYRNLKVFTTYRGVTMFRASIGRQFAVYAVEQDENALKITIMFAGHHGNAVTIANYYWDGFDDNALCSGLLHARAAVWFT